MVPRSYAGHGMPCPYCGKTNGGLLVVAAVVCDVGVVFRARVVDTCRAAPAAVRPLDAIQNSPKEKR